MLIIQIALGIVLAVVLLAFLPQIFSLSIWGIVAAVIIGIIVLAIHLASEYIPNYFWGAIIIMYVIGLIYTLISDAIEWKPLRKMEKINELEIEIHNLQQLLSIIEKSDNNSKTLENSLKSQRNIKEKLKIKKEKLEKLKSEATKSSLGTQ
jgi:hypothetical protein